MNSRIANQCTRRFRNGFTLLEIILVVVVLVVMAAITTPLALQSIQDGKLRGSTDKIQGAFAEARTKAIRTGNQYAFYFSNNGTGFYVSKYDPLRATDVPSWVSEEFDGSPNSVTGGHFLETGVRFITQDIGTDSRSQQAGASDVAGFERILFYPDGQVQPAKVFLQNEMGDRRAIVLRAITGSSRAYNADESWKEIE